MTATASNPVRTKAHVTPAARIIAAVSGVMVLVALAGCGGTETVALAKGFPTSAVPVVDGDVTASTKSGVAYNATVKVKDTKAQQDALSKLKKKGFVVIGTSGTSNADRVYSLANSKYSVRLAFTGTGGDLAIKYGVSPRAASK